MSKTEDRWLSRWRLPTGAMAAWSEQDWTEWLSEGLEIWFSQAPRAERELAFAPLYVTSDREDPEVALGDGLRGFYDLTAAGPEASAVDVLARQQRIEDAFVAVMSNRRYVRSKDCAMLVIGIAAELRMRHLGRLIQALLAAFDRGWIEGPHRELLSRVGHTILDAGLSKVELLALRQKMERLLEDEENYRSILNFCLAAYDDDVVACIDNFQRLWRKGPGRDSTRVWRKIAQQLNTQFGEDAVSEAIEQLQASPSSVEAIPTGFIAGKALSSFYDVEQFGLDKVAARARPLYGVDSARRGHSVALEEV